MADEFAKKYTFMIDVAIAMENKIKESYADLTIAERRSVLNNAFYEGLGLKAYPGLFESALNMKLMDDHREMVELFGKYKESPWKLVYVFSVQENANTIKRLNAQKKSLKTENLSVKELEEKKYLEKVIEDSEKLVKYLRTQIEICKNKEEMRKKLVEFCEDDELGAAEKYFKQMNFI